MADVKPVVSNEKPEKTLLNAYIYDYLLKNDLVRSASAFLSESDCPVSHSTTQGNSPSRRSNKGNEDTFATNGLNEADQSLDVSIPTLENTKSEQNWNRKGHEEEGLKEGSDEKPPNAPSSRSSQDLPSSSVPIDAPSGFLYEWWSIFWDIYSARSGKGGSGQASAYISHTQRMRQEQHRTMSSLTHPGMMAPHGQMMNVPGFNPAMMRGMMPNGVQIPSDAEFAALNGGQMSDKQRQQAALQRQAVLNRGGKVGYPPTAVQLHQLKNQQLMQHQQQMAREHENRDSNGRPPSPGNQSDSPSKRQRLSPDGVYAAMAGNGRGQPMPQQSNGGPQNTQQLQQVQQMLMQAGINPNGLTQAQILAFQSQTPQAQQKQLQAYTQGLASQQQRAMANSAAKNQGMPGGTSPMMQQGSDGQMGLMPETFYAGMPPQAMRGIPGGNHALQDYQMQLMLLEQQNKKRLMMARQEQERLQPVREGEDTSPSASLMDMGKRGTPKLGSQIPGSPMLDANAMVGGPRHQSPQLNGPNGQIPADPQQQAIMFNQMKMNDMIMGPNGQLIGRGQPGQPQQFTAQQMQEMLQQRTQQGQRGQMWQQQQLMQMGVGGRNQNPQQQQMPPPQAPATQNKTQPNSPNPQARPPTPTQSHKAVSKKKEKGETKKVD